MDGRLEVSQSQATPRLAVTAVRAAGGLIRRRVRQGWRRHDEFAVVHRPRYDDWSFPKGKQDPGESDEETARREVFEETGFWCRLGPEIGATRYEDNRGRKKLVRYWLMELEKGAPNKGFVPNREVDELRWLSTDEASRLLTYEHDRELLGRLAEILRNRPRRQRSGGIPAASREGG